MRNLLIFLIRVYQLAISQALPHSCRFNPTCSQYAVHAVQEYGVIKGIFLAIKRILRCNPFFIGGYDPVPPKSGVKT